MQQNRLIRLISLIGFIAFAVVSCWATTESLHMLLPSWPKILCWIVTIGFFVIASIGTKMIVDSLNQNIYLQNRNVIFLGGVIITLLFWLVCSMPTNTHTFFYRSTVCEVAEHDLQTTKSYLLQLRDNIDIEEGIKAKQEDIANKVEIKLRDLEDEIDNVNNVGDGPNAKKILYEIAQLLQCDPIPPLSGAAQSSEQRQARKTQYREKVHAQLEIFKQHIRKTDSRLASVNYQADATKNLDDLSAVEEEFIYMNIIKRIDNNVISRLDLALQKSYATIKNYSSYITFMNDADKARYTAKNPLTETSRLLSVFEVWKDYLAGEYKGRSFSFWLIISILVDVAAFIFFDIAFRKEE